MTGPAQDGVTVHHIRVRYAETDQMGVAHHGSYVPWIEEARTEWLRERGTSYREIEEGGFALAVTRVDIRYFRPARYDDVVRIETRLLARHMASITIGYTLFATQAGARGERLAEARTRLALIGRDGRPMRISDVLFADGGAGSDH